MAGGPPDVRRWLPVCKKREGGSCGMREEKESNNEPWVVKTRSTKRRKEKSSKKIHC